MIVDVFTPEWCLGHLGPWVGLGLGWAGLSAWVNLGLQLGSFWVLIYGLPTYVLLYICTRVCEKISFGNRLRLVSIVRYLLAIGALCPPPTHALIAVVWPDSVNLGSSWVPAYIAFRTIWVGLGLGRGFHGLGWV